MNSVKEINIKNRTNFFFDNKIYIKILDPNKIKMKIHAKYSYLSHWIPDIVPPSPPLL